MARDPAVPRIRPSQYRAIWLAFALVPPPRLPFAPRSADNFDGSVCESCHPGTMKTTSGKEIKSAEFDVMTKWASNPDIDAQGL